MRLRNGTEASPETKLQGDSINSMTNANITSIVDFGGDGAGFQDSSDLATKNALRHLTEERVWPAMLAEAEKIALDHKKASDIDIANAGAFWWVGTLADLGKQRGYIAAQDGSLDPASVEAGWWEAWDDDSKQWRAAPALQCALTPADDDEVQLVGERSRQEKDAELRKRAIDLEAESPADGKRAPSRAPALPLLRRARSTWRASSACRRCSSTSLTRCSGRRSHGAWRTTGWNPS